MATLLENQLRRTLNKQWGPTSLYFVHRVNVRWHRSLSGGNIPQFLRMATGTFAHTTASQSRIVYEKTPKIVPLRLSFTLQNGHEIIVDPYEPFEIALDKFHKSREAVGYMAQCMFEAIEDDEERGIEYLEEDPEWIEDTQEDYYSIEHLHYELRSIRDALIVTGRVGGWLQRGITDYEQIKERDEKKKKKKKEKSGADDADTVLPGKK